MELVVRELAQVVEQESEARDVRGKGGLEFGWDVQELTEIAGGRPTRCRVMKEEREDDRQRLVAGVLAHPVVPNPRHVHEKARGHARVDRALVLEEHVDLGFRGAVEEG